MINSDDSMEVNLSHFEFFSFHAGIADKFIAACTTEDDIGVVLRIHLLLEKDVEVWCACASKNGKFFDGFNENLTMEFSSKAQLAFNFGLSSDLLKAVKRINRIRNVRAHQIDNFALTDPEIESLIALLRSNYPPRLVPIEDFKIQIDGMEKFGLMSNETPNRLKFIILYAVLKMRMREEALNLWNSRH
ncbi:hypothetical protein [uncultured Klebsiella sp.]|uniref:hypothetical protein n=1 Tax=uncultured Klebsiella sp. TaxID=284011 RepID=UPI00280466A2|nr:hypothetical protein [uncultured Klebsiella sp.]